MGARTYQPYTGPPVPTFCRHNRFLHNCPICREVPPPRAHARPGAATSPARAARPAATRGPQRARGGRGVKVRRVARAEEDGYRCELVPGLKASADAERLADELAFSAARLAELAADPPGAYADVAGSPDREEAIWLAFLIAWLCPVTGEEPFAAVRGAHTPWASGELPDLAGVTLGPRAAASPTPDAATLVAYRAWAARAGTQQAAVHGQDVWSPERRLDRAFERLALPGLERGARFDFLVTLGRLGVLELRAGSLRFGTDAATLAAKRVFGIGDTILLERRAADLAGVVDLPLDVLDLALFNWAQPAGQRAEMGSGAAADPAVRAAVAAALGVEG